MSKRSLRQQGKDFKYGEELPEKEAEENQDEDDNDPIPATTPLGKLFRACRVGDLVVVKRLIRKGVNPSQYPVNNSYEWYEEQFPNPFCVACAHGHIDIVKFLASCGNVDPNYTKDQRPTALMAACFAGHLNVVKVLVENYHANVLQKTPRSYYAWKTYLSEHNTALDYACYGGHIHIAEYLLQKGCFSKTRIQSILLDISADDRLVPVLQYFLAKDVDMNFASAEGFSPIYVACMADCVSVVKLLISQAHVDVGETIKKWCSPLTAAIIRGSKTCIKLLMRTGNVSVNKPDINGDLPLVIACMTNEAKLVPYLINKYNSKIPPRITKILGKKHCDSKTINLLYKLYTKKEQAPVIVFLCALHPRCGQASSLAIFPHDIILHVAKLALNKRVLQL